MKEKLGDNAGGPGGDGGMGGDGGTGGTGQTGVTFAIYSAIWKDGQGCAPPPVYALRECQALPSSLMTTAGDGSAGTTSALPASHKQTMTCAPPLMPPDP